jgi:hypothetical protein
VRASFGATFAEFAEPQRRKLVRRSFPKLENA